MKTPRTNPLLPAMLLLALCFGAVTGLPAADPPAAPTPRAVVDKAIADALAILRDSKLSSDDKRQKINKIALDNIDFDTMARLCLGRFYRGLTDAQRAAYTEAFKTHVINTYRHITDNYNDEEVKMIGDRQERDNDWTIQTRIVGAKDNKPGQEVAKVDYRLRSRDNQWKIIDLTIDGVSLVSNFRSQFQEIMNNGGIDKLLQLLREKNTANEK